MRENVFGAIVLTAITVAFFVIGLKVPEVAAMAVITALITIWLWCEVFGMMDIQKRKPNIQVKLEQARDGEDPLYNCFYLNITIDGRTKSILVLLEDAEELRTML